MNSIAELWMYSYLNCANISNQMKMCESPMFMAEVLFWRLKLSDEPLFRFVMHWEIFSRMRQTWMCRDTLILNRSHISYEHDQPGPWAQLKLTQESVEYDLFVLMIFVAKIEKEAKPLHIVIVAVWWDITLLQQPNITVSQLCGYFKYRMISSCLISLLLGCYPVSFLQDFLCESMKKWSP